MKCPHCNTGIHEDFQRSAIVTYKPTKQKDGFIVGDVVWSTKHQRCPECLEAIIFLDKNIAISGLREEFLAYPQSSSRPIPTDVTDPYKTDFSEACMVLKFSPKASAALSRRCLQSILRDKGQTKARDLADQIDELLTGGAVPAYVADGLHALRNIGNFGAHPIKSTNTGEIVEVEPGEAEWNLDVLESLFDFYFVQPALSAKRKTELNKKLKEAGKPEVK